MILQVNGLQPALPVMPLRTLPTSPPKPETYLDIYKRRAALRLSNGGNLKQREAHNPLANSTWFRSNPTVPVEKGEAVHTGVHDPLNPDALGLTWPGTVSYGVVKASNSTSRQISADAANLAGMCIHKHCAHSTYIKHDNYVKLHFTLTKKQFI